MLAPEMAENLSGRLPMLWLNPGERILDDPFLPERVDRAEQRLLLAGPLLARVLPELAGTDGLIESPLIKADAMRDALGGQSRWFLKADNRLPVAGSVKARGLESRLERERLHRAGGCRMAGLLLRLSVGRGKYGEPGHQYRPVVPCAWFCR